MPLILIVVAVAVALGAAFMFMGGGSTTPETQDTVPTARTEETTTVTEPADSETDVTIGTEPIGDEGPTYNSGEYSATASYTTPGRSTHDVTATVTIANDIVTAATVSFAGDDNTTSTGLQNKFAAAFQTEVVGKKLDEISLSRVGGASLTTGAFNKALAEVKVQAN